MDLAKSLYRLKEEQGYSYGFLAEKSGIEAGTIQKILTGQTKHPRRQTMECLMEVYLELSEKHGYMITIDLSKGIEPEKQGGYTVADWESLPKGTHMELIDGVMYDMAPPFVRHQVIASEIFSRFREYILNKKGKCVPILSPVGVQIDRDNKSMLEPDLIVVCDPGRFGDSDGKWLFGAPDFVLEVLSDSTRKRDMTIKLQKYENGGVKEYWVVDPDREIVIVYEFEAEVTPTIYSFNDIIPVGIYSGKLKIDFNEICAMLKVYEPWKND